MGNSVNILKRQSTGAAGKVILADGTIHRFDESLTVAELMLEHPQQVVVEFQTIAGGNKPTPLPADKELEMEKIYVMIPIKRGKPVALSSEESRRLLFAANSFLKSKSFLVSYTGFLPFVAGILSPGMKSEGSRRFNCELALEGKKRLVDQEEKASKLHDLFAEVLESRPEYLSRQLSRRGWKPSLEPIKEKCLKKKKVF